MSIDDLKKYPNPILRTVAEEVGMVEETVQSLIRDMFKIMDEANGVGLAAPQIGVSRRVIVVSLNEKNFERLALINPVIERVSEELVSMEEGCLSIPGVNADVVRPSKAVVRGLTRSGRMVEITAANLLARVLQHEIDHLNGVLFIDRISEADRKRVEEELSAPAASRFSSPEGHALL
jgi:peptide deformylase